MDYVLSELLGITVFVFPILLVFAIGTALALYAFGKISKERSLSDLLLIGTAPGVGFPALMALLFGREFVAITERYPFSLGSLALPSVVLMLVALWLFRNKTVAD